MVSANMVSVLLNKTQKSLDFISELIREGEPASLSAPVKVYDWFSCYTMIHYTIL